MARKRRKPKQPYKLTRQQLNRSKRVLLQRELLRPIVREAAKAGAAEAIEHCGNFWSVSDGYKKYIDYQIKTAVEELMAAVRTALGEELSPFRREIARARRRKR